MRGTLLFSVLTATYVHSEKREPDSLVPVRRFSCGKLYYRKFFLAEDVHDASLYVGAMDTVFKLPAANINSSRCNSGHLKLPPENVGNCTAQSKSASYECRNHIKVIQSIGRDRLYICGTNAANPKDWVFEESLRPTRDIPPGIGNGTGKCPFSPDDISTAIWVEIGNPDDLPGLYAGTTADGDGKLSGIYRTPLFDETTGNQTFSEMKTLNDTKWLNSPDFVGAFDIDRYVYFFFRDVLTDEDKDEANVVSLVGRVCKEDTGIRKLDGIFATYSKAQLSCYIPGMLGLFPTYFNEIQAVYKSLKDDRMFYASFASPENEDSVICAFPLEYINDAFNGDYRENGVWSQDDTLLLYRDPQYRPGTCGYDTQILPDAAHEFVPFHGFMKAEIRYLGGRPFYQGEGVVFVSLAYHREEHNGDEYTVLYTGTADGRVIKVVKGKDSSDDPIDEEWDVMEGHAIHTMELSLEHRSLYVSSDVGVAQLEIKVCSGPDVNLTRAEWYECVLGKEEAALITTRRPTTSTVRPTGPRSTGKYKARSSMWASARGVHSCFDVSLIIVPGVLLLLRHHNFINGA